MSALITAILNGNGVLEVISLPGFSVPWSWLTFALFFGFAMWWIWGLESYKNQREHSEPNVVYDSPEALMYNNACWVRLKFRNKVKHPSGDISTSQDTRAIVEVFKANGTRLDSWNGRWSESAWPSLYGDIPKMNKWPIIAGDIARLDIGRRVVGEAQFKGHHNWHPESPLPQRELLKPDSYYVRTELWGANWEPRESWFKMQVPNEPQSKDTTQIKITLTRKPKFRKEGAQVE